MVRAGEGWVMDHLFTLRRIVQLVNVGVLIWAIVAVIEVASQGRINASDWPLALLWVGYPTLNLLALRRPRRELADDE